MQLYFLTVGDKNPIMFNDMLCECAWVESGLQLRGPSSNVCLPSLLWLWSAELHIHMYTLSNDHVIMLMKFLLQHLPSIELHQKAKDFLKKLLSSSKPLEKYMQILEYSLLWVTHELVSFSFFLVFCIKCFHSIWTLILFIHDIAGFLWFYQSNKMCMICTCGFFTGDVASSRSTWHHRPGNWVS